MPCRCGPMRRGSSDKADAGLLVEGTIMFAPSLYTSDYLAVNKAQIIAMWLFVTRLCKRGCMYGVLAKSGRESVDLRSGALSKLFWGGGEFEEK